MTQHVVHISTNITTGCQHCNHRIGGGDFAESVNHYIQKHNYKVMHIGTETITDSDGRPYHITVAVLGL